MYKTATLSVLTNAEKLFNFLVLFYPEQYRKKYGQEMFMLFQDMYQEELTKNGNIGLGFWFFQVGDITKSIIEQHIDEIGKKGMKKYLQQTFHINTYNVIGGILLLPIFIVFFIDVIARIVQGDLVHYNRPVYAFLSHTFFYQFPIQFTWVVLFPILAVAINIVPLIGNARKKHFNVLNLTFLKRNAISILFLVFGLFFVLLIKFHDFAPCMFYGLTHFGFGQLNHIISVCRKA